MKFNKTIGWLYLVGACLIVLTNDARLSSLVQAQPGVHPIALSVPKDELQHNVKVEKVTFKNRQALRVMDIAKTGDNTDRRLVILPGTDLQEGEITMELAGELAPNAAADARGFVGIAFRVQPNAEKFECFYLRPTNGRADDQVRRNHSTQYISYPDFPWFRLRKEFPEKYESYVDLEPGVWTKVKIKVSGTKASLYVHGATQPTLIVNDLKLGNIKGSIGLWVGPGTIAHFTEMSSFH